MGAPPLGEPAMKRERWEDCRKAVASSEETAREYLAYLLRHAANFHKPSGYVVRPYPSIWQGSACWMRPKEADGLVSAPPR
jgi:hypothetical protein